MDENPELEKRAAESGRSTRSLSKKLTLAVVAATCVILIVTIWFSYSQARNALEQQSNTEALKQVQSTAVTFDAYLDRVAVLPRAITARKEATGGAAAHQQRRCRLVLHFHRRHPRALGDDSPDHRQHQAGLGDHL